MNNARETTRLWEWDVVPGSLWAINTNYRWKDNLCFCNMIWFYFNSGFTPDSYITRFVKHVLLWPPWMVSQERWKRLTHSDDSCNLSMINSQIVLLSTKLFPFYWLNTMCIEFSNTHITAIMWSWVLSLTLVFLPDIGNIQNCLKSLCQYPAPNVDKHPTLARRRSAKQPEMDTD